MTTRVLSLSAGTSNGDNNAFFGEIMFTFKAIKSFFERSHSWSFHMKFFKPAKVSFDKSHMK